MFKFILRQEPQGKRIFINFKNGVALTFDKTILGSNSPGQVGFFCEELHVSPVPAPILSVFSCFVILNGQNTP